MEEIKAPKKERKFLKAVGNIAKVLANELVMGIARKFIGKAIDKVGNKKQGLSIVLIIIASTFAFAQYPTTSNKQRLGFQTTGDGLLWRGSISDTASIQPTNNQNAWVIIDTVNLKLYLFDFTSNVWNLVGGATSGLIMPFDSITFNTAKDGTVGVGEVEYNDTQGSLIQGLKGGNVTNVIGQQLHQRVNNRTGATLSKGTAVFLSGSQGNRITVAKALGVTDAFSANTFGIVAESIANNQSGYVITEGLITNINTSALTEDSAVYLSPTVAGGLTSTKPQAPQHTVYIGVCVKSNPGSGELFVKIRNGQELNELHDVRITSPVDKASLYYKSSEGLWRDTTAALLVSDTAAMFANYATKAYADTTGRLYARQDFTNVSTSTLTWTQSDTLIPGGVNVVQVYRNGQILLPSQYTIPTSTSVVIAASSFKVNDNYTVIFPRGGGAGSGSGSGSLTSISGGTGITVSPNPITTTGTVSADLSVLMELTDTSLLNLTSRFASKLNTTDTVSLSNRINAKGTGTVTSVATGYGLTGGTITTSGTLLLDSSVVFSRIRDSIVDVAIGNDTIKILKQEYAPATTSVLTWTITPKFPIQLKQYILVFRNGQLLINDQYNLTDTNKITIVSNSFKVGSNYTVVTVSGIGSVGTGVFPNPVYPEAGIALSTGTTWASSIPNNSTNWNTAYTDRLKWDGGATGLTPSTGRTSLGGTTIGQSMFTLTNPSTITFPRFNADNTVTALTATNFRAAIGAGTVTNVIASTTAGNPISITNNTTTPTIELLSSTTSRNGYLSSTDWTTFNNKQAALSGLGFIKANGTTITYDNSTYLTTSSASTTYLAKTDTAAMLLPYFRDADTTTLNLTSRFASKLNISDTAAMLSNYNTRINSKLNISDTTLMLSKYLRRADTSLLNLTSRFNTKLNILDTASMLLPYFKDADTTSLNLTSRFATKLNISDTAAMLANYNSRINLKLNISDTAAMLIPYLRKLDTVSLSNRINLRVNISDTLNMLLPYLRKADTTLMLTPYLRRADTSLLNLTSRFNTKLNYTDTSFLFTQSDTNQLNLTSRFGLKFNTADTTQLNLTSRFAEKQNTLSGTGFVKASGTNITYDNSSYLRTGLADSSYLKLTGGTLTGGLTGTTALFSGNVAIGFPFAYKPLEVISNANDFVSVGVRTLGYYQWSGIHFGYREPNTQYRKSAIVFQRNDTGLGGSDGSGKIHILNVNIGNTFKSADLSDAKLTISNNGFVGINDTSPSFNLDVTGTLNATGATTLGSTLAVTGNITEAGNNVLTNLDTASLSSRIDAKVGLTGNEYINGQKTFGGLIISTNGMQLTATGNNSNKLIGINASSFVGEVTLGTGLTLTSNVLNASTTDTISLSNRINLKYDITGGTISGKAILNDSARFEGNVLFKKNMGLPIVKISNADYTATTANHTIIYTVLTADKTLTIPNASDAIGIKYIISIFDIPEGNEALTLVTPSLNLFVSTDGESSSVDIVGGYCTTIQSDGTKWYILSYAPMY